MILSKKQIKQILDIIKKRHHLFVAKTIGKDFVSDEDLIALTDEYGEAATSQIEDFIKDSYYVGFMRSKDLGSAVDMSHSQFKNIEKPVLNELQQYSIEHAKSVTNSYVQKMSQDTRTTFENVIRKYNKMYKDHVMTNVGVPMAILAQKEGDSVSQLVTELRDVTGDYARDWHRVSTTETTNVINSGMADKIIKMNEGVDAKKIYVIKRVVNDAELCPHCRRLHLESDGVTPKIYTMEQALANGSNVGRKANDWEFTINSVHCHCRCQLVQLPPGYWFNDEGAMEYIGEKDAQEVVDKNLQE